MFFLCMHGFSLWVLWPPQSKDMTVSELVTLNCPCNLQMCKCEWVWDCLSPYTVCHPCNDLATCPGCALPFAQRQVGQALPPT